MLQQDPGLAAAVSAPPLVDARCPYRGLVPYDVDDDDTFFGRDREVETCLRRLAVAVPGRGRGVGERQVVAAPRRCGQPAASGRPPVAVFTPGADPLGSLAATLATTDPSTVLVIDQLEELVALGASAEAAASSSTTSLSGWTVGRVVVALRGDHVGSIGDHPAFARQLEDGLHLVTAMTEEELRAVIEQPATGAGLRWSRASSSCCCATFATSLVGCRCCRSLWPRHGPTAKAGS